MYFCGAIKNFNSMDIVVLFSNRGDPDCQRIPVLWDGLPNVTVFELTGDMCMEDVESATETALNTPCDILIVCGHGTPFGLLSPNWDYYVVHEYNCDVLNQRTTVGLFCHATNFATANRLNGFYTDMFISNVNEANDYCVECTLDEIETQNTQFFLRVRQLIENNTPLENWKYYMDIDSSDVARFNAGNVQYFNWDD